jgi:long-subunit fatty acid transport protein
VRFCAVLFASLLASAAAQAYPLLSPHEVPSAIAGPSDAHVASMVQNPAAIGPLRGLHVYTEGAARFYSGSIAPDSAGHRVLIGWTNPEGFIGLTWDLLNDRIAIGFAVHSPFVELSSYSDPAVRYHEIWQRFATLEENVSFSLRLAKNIFVGGGANFDESWIDYEYVRDAAVYGGTNGLSDANGLCAPNPCGYENPLAGQLVRLRGFNAGAGFTLGALVRPVDRVWIGAGFASHIFNASSDSSSLRQDNSNGQDLPLSDSHRARVTPAPGQRSPPCGSDSSGALPCFGADVVRFALPDRAHFGVHVELTPRIDVEVSGRYTHYGRPALDVRLQGAQLAALVEPSFRLNRGLGDAWAGEVGVRVRVSDKLRPAGLGQRRRHRLPLSAHRLRVRSRRPGPLRRRKL